MATKAAIKKGDDRSGKRQEAGALSNFSGNAMGVWSGFTRFLSDVRAEMRKVVTPTPKEVQSTTSVVIIAVFHLRIFLLCGGLRIQQSPSGVTAQAGRAIRRAAANRDKNGRRIGPTRRAASAST